jgi:DNA ligase (NAD+)
MYDILKRASEAYYKGTPFMSDTEFDILSAHFNYKDVGHTVTNGIPHFYRMYSLKKCYDINEAPLDINSCIKTVKLDGAAVSLLYVDGNLSLALTRGDGIIGRDITDKLSYIVPQNIGWDGLIQITGEVLAPKYIPNARNYAAGALNLNSLEEFKTRELVFVAYGVQGVDIDSWSESMHKLAAMDFLTVLTFDHTDYPTDGVVYRIDSNTNFNGMGYTANHPRGAFALKTQKSGVVTTLKDVIWQVGKSGLVSPVAILEPVYVEDALVSRATLHNIEYIEGLNLEIGCKVEIIRSGEIIPRVVRRVG